jgi:hypothetical protein
MIYGISREGLYGNLEGLGNGYRLQTGCLLAADHDFGGSAAIVFPLRSVSAAF